MSTPAPNAGPSAGQELAANGGVSGLLSKTIIIVVAISMIRAVTIMVLWNWFVAGDQAPFPQLPELSIIDALGLSTLLAVITWQGPRAEDAQRSLRATAGHVLWYYAVAWVFALIVRALQ